MASYQKYWLIVGGVFILISYAIAASCYLAWQIEPKYAVGIIAILFLCGLFALGNLK